MALVDEADSILIDEARTPLILSQQRLNVQQQRYWREALDIAMRMRDGQLISRSTVRLNKQC